MKNKAMASETQVVESCFVAPSRETPRKGQWVSSLDLERANRGHTPLVYFFDDPRPRGSTHGFFDPSRLKEAMAKALVPFYPLAGRAGVDGDGRTQIDCNSEGALFVVARSELTLADLDDLKPSPELRTLFVPRIEPPSVLLAVQVTFMRCGGVVLETAFHHVAVDAMGDFHFMQTWSALCRDGDGAAVELPCHDRTLLRARSPPVVHPDALSVLYRPNMASGGGGSEPDAPPPAPTSAAVFSISDGQLAALRRACGGASTFCAVGALAWQCACAARRLAPDAETRVSFSADIRRRAMRPPLPARYLGNGIITLCATGAAGDVCSEPLERVAGRVQGARDRVDDELVRSAIDYYHELLEMESAAGRRLRGDAMAGTELRVVSWLGMPLFDADFGWGKPRRVSRAGSVRGGYVHLTRSGTEAGSGIRVLVCLEAANMEEFERLFCAKLEGLLLHAKL